MVDKARRHVASTDAKDRSEHSVRYLEAQIRMGWPEPATEEECYRCVNERRMVAHRPVGWLATAKPPKQQQPPKAPKPPSRTTLTRRLNQAEAKAEKLRQDLAQAEAETGPLRSERHGAQGAAPESTAER